MATRRSRIKGIANIPQRRKVENKVDDNELEKEVKVANEAKEDAPEDKSNNEAASEPAKQDKKEEAPRRRPFIKPTVNTKLLAEKSKLKIEVKEPEKSYEERVNAPEPCLASSTDLTESEKSDTETPCPLSPTKFMNRSRIKAIPRLGQRRISTTFYGSASESEDDTRKLQKRTKADSICSNVDPVKEKKKEFSSVIQRKCKRTEQSRKMAEAKRHFMHKFGNQPPDKQKLTMIDLIFYNPTSNPMSQKPKKQVMEEQPDDPVQKEETEEQEEQAKEEEALPSEEEDALPAPQIKIGANGEIVIDEKSLIIENLQTKKDREELQKSKIVDGDFDTGYGVFKREKRSKDWSKAETIRFYKALNTLGTDFTLMMELFSGRTRRELKMKFKKEERVNRALVDKALTQPMQFDITELRKEVEEEQQRLEEEAEEKKKQKEASKQIPYIARVGSKEKPKKRKVLGKRDIYKKLAKGVASVWSSDSEDESEEDAVQLRPTRSGRMPKPKKPFTYEESMAVERRAPAEDNSEPVEENMNDMNIQPGSVVILTSQTSAGPSFKVFMVTPNQSRVPLALTSDVVDNLTQSANNQALGQNVTIDNVVVAEGSVTENVTIPDNAENVTEKAVASGNVNILENVTITGNITIQENLTISEGITQQGDIITLPLDGEITGFSGGESIAFSTEGTCEGSVENDAGEESADVELSQNNLKMDYESFPIEFSSENSELCTVAKENTCKLVVN